MALIHGLASFLLVWIRALALLNAFTPVHRAWILQEAQPQTIWPSATWLSVAYGILQSFNMALMWVIGLANEPWVIVLSLSLWHLWATEIASLVFSHNRRYHRQNNDGAGKVRDVSNAPSVIPPELAWAWKLSILLPIQNAAAIDAALLLFADKLRGPDAFGMEKDPIRTMVTFAAMLAYLIGFWGDSRILRVLNIGFLPSSLEHVGTMVRNAILLLGTRAGVAWMMGPSELPLLAIVSCTTRSHTSTPPSDKWIRDIAEKSNPLIVWGTTGVSMLVLWPCGVYFLLKARRSGAC